VHRRKAGRARAPRCTHTIFRTGSLLVLKAVCVWLSGRLRNGGRVVSTPPVQFETICGVVNSSPRLLLRSTSIEDDRQAVLKWSYAHLGDCAQRKSKCCEMDQNKMQLAWSSLQQNLTYTRQLLVVCVSLMRVGKGLHVCNNTSDAVALFKNLSSVSAF
jgi:hypothetical protein